MAFPQVGITSFAGFQGPNFALNSPTTDIQLGDTISWIKGNHLFKFGGVYVRNRVDQNGRPYYTGNISLQRQRQPDQHQERARRRIARKLHQLSGSQC